MGNRFYIYEGETWLADEKGLRFIRVSDLETIKSYTSIDPDSLDKFVEVKPNKDTFNKNAPKEKLYRVITDMTTMLFLSEDSFTDISRNVLDYLQEIEEWERMCVVRDVGKYYWNYREKRKARIEEQIKKHDRPAANNEV